MLVFLENKLFLIGKFKEVINFLFNKIKKSKASIIVLPFSLNDLASKDSAVTAAAYENIDYCTNDSMFITYFFRYKYKKEIDRLYGPNLMLFYLNKFNKDENLKHYFLASDFESMESLKNFVKNKYGKALYCEFGFLPKDIHKKSEQLYLKNILSFKPNFIWIGIGSPKQVLIADWLKTNSSGILIFCVGAAFDFLSGRKKQAPAWVQRNGLEWLYRFFSEPRRLWKRYFIFIPGYFLSKLLKK